MLVAWYTVANQGDNQGANMSTNSTLSSRNASNETTVEHTVRNVPDCSHFRVFYFNQYMSEA